MDTKFGSSNIAHFPVKAERTRSPYDDFVQQLHESRRVPLRLVIDCERFASWQLPQRPLIDQLGLELQLWASVLGPRTVIALYLVHPHRHLQAFELTRLLHCVASKFKVSSSVDKRFTVITDVAAISATHLALLKGLGFNTYHIVVTEEGEAGLEVLAQKTALIRGYAFDRIGIQLLHSDCITSIRTHMRGLQKACQPDYISVGPAWDDTEVIYAAHDPEPLLSSEEQSDFLHLGPEACSAIGELRVQSYCAEEKYRAALENHRLPIHISHGGSS